MDFKGQSSLEFLTVIGIGMVLAAPFIIQAQDSMIDVILSSEAAEFESSMNKLDESIQTVHAMGEPAKQTIDLEVPQGIESAQIYNQNSLVYTQERAGNTANYTRIYDFDIHAENDLPVEEGHHQVEVEAWNTQVNISTN